MYMTVLSARHLSKLSPLFTNLCIIANLSATLLTIIMGLTGAITENALWFGICALIMVAQELIIMGIVNVSSHRMGHLFDEFEAQTGTSYQVQRRKLWIIRITTTVLVLISVANVFLSETGNVYALASPRRPIGFSLEAFDATYPIPDVLTALAHVVLLYALQRPTNTKTSNNGVVSLDRSRSTGV